MNEAGNGLEVECVEGDGGGDLRGLRSSKDGPFFPQRLKDGER